MSLQTKHVIDIIYSPIANSEPPKRYTNGFHPHICTRAKSNPNTTTALITYKVNEYTLNIMTVFPAEKSSQQVFRVVERGGHDGRCPYSLGNTAWFTKAWYEL